MEVVVLLVIFVWGVWYVVEGGYEVGCEEVGEDVVDDIVDVVDGKDVEVVVDWEDVFVFDDVKGVDWGDGIYEVGYVYGNCFGFLLVFCIWRKRVKKRCIKFGSRCDVD